MLQNVLFLIAFPLNQDKGRETIFHARFSVFFNYTVAYTAHSLDHIARAAELRAKRADMNVYGTGLPVEIISPYLVENEISRKYGTVTRYEKLQKVEFLQGKRYLFSFG